MGGRTQAQKGLAGHRNSALFDYLSMMVQDIIVTPAISEMGTIYARVTGPVLPTSFQRHTVVLPAPTDAGCVSDPSQAWLLSPPKQSGPCSPGGWQNRADSVYVGMA